jgi:hypothetical protein
VKVKNSITFTPEVAIAYMYDFELPERKASQPIINNKTNID